MLKLVALVFFCGAVVVANASSLTRVARQTSDEQQIINDVNEQLTNTIDKIWGGKCITDDQCLEFISYCKHEQVEAPITITNPVGECRPNWWTWLILALIVVILVGGCISCCMLGCACICKCFGAIFDCLCCCCRNKGYSPANRG